MVLFETHQYIQYNLMENVPHELQRLIPPHAGRETRSDFQHIRRREWWHGGTSPPPPTKERSFLQGSFNLKHNKLHASLSEAFTPDYTPQLVNDCTLALAMGCCYY